MYRSWLLVVILGCAGSTKPAQTTPVVAPPPPSETASCAKVSDHLIDLMSANAKDAPPDAIKHVHDVVLERCDHDQWSAEARQCFVNVSERKDGERCNQMLTDAQRGAIEQAMGGGAKSESPSPAAEPAPPPPPATMAPSNKPAPTRSAVPKAKKGGDPCEGGE